MREPMSLDRFALLADAYGSATARWPVAERAAAERLARDPAARALLADAARLDTTLDAWTAPMPSGALSRRIAAAAPVSRAAWLGRAKLWWSGLGLAAAMAGAVAGSIGAAAFAPSASTWDTATAFGDPGGEVPL